MKWREALELSLVDAEHAERPPVVLDCNDDPHWVIMENDAPALETESGEVAPFGRAGEPYKKTPAGWRGVC